MFHAVLGGLLSDSGLLTGRNHTHPTYQKEHSLLQALLGELVKAALADKLLKERDEVLFVPKATSVGVLAGPRASLMSPFTLL